MRDVVLDGPALNRLIQGVQAAFSSPDSARWLLREIGYPEHRLPNFDTHFDAAWREAFRDLATGIIPQPYRRVFDVSLRVFRYHPEIRPLAEELGLIDPDSHEVIELAKDRLKEHHGAPAVEDEPASADGPRTVRLDPGEFVELLQVIRRRWWKPANAQLALRRIRYPTDDIPNFEFDAGAAWFAVFRDLEVGVAGGFGPLLRDYAAHTELRDVLVVEIAQRHGIDLPGPRS
jgi:hypothetical protein